MSKSRSSVLLVRWSSLTHFSFLDALYDLDILDRIYESKHIAIKVNLAAGTRFVSGSPVVTNSTILEFMVAALLEANQNLKISIVEADSVGMGFAYRKFEHQGYPRLFSDYFQVNLVDLSRSPLELFELNGRFFKEGIALPRIFREIDFFISLGKMKTHLSTVITGCLKNQFGCLPETDKHKYHPFLPSVIADINSVIRPDLSILEACPAMEGGGPIFGSERDLDLILIGEDPVAIDAVAARIMGFDARRIPMLRVAQDSGLGVADYHSIDIIGYPMEEFVTKFKYVGLGQCFFIHLGLAIQRIGISISRLGHRIHLIQGVAWLISKVMQRTWRGIMNGLLHSDN